MWGSVTAAFFSPVLAGTDPMEFWLVVEGKEMEERCRMSQRTIHSNEG